MLRREREGKMLACFASGSGLDARGGKRLKTRVDGPSTSGSFIPAATAGASLLWHCPSALRAARAALR